MRRTDPDAEDKAYDQMRQDEMDSEPQRLFPDIPRVQQPRTPYGISVNGIFAGVIAADRLSRSRYGSGQTFIDAYADGHLIYTGYGPFLFDPNVPVERIPCF